MARYRLLALDMDGTLLTSDKRISEATLGAIRSAAERGVAIALSTGRAVNELTEYRQQLAGTIRYASLLSGGQVIDLDASQTIFCSPFETEIACAIIQAGIEEDAMPHVLTTTTTAATQRDIDRMDEVGMGIYQRMFQQICTPVDDVRTFVRVHGGEVCKVNLYHKDQRSRMRTCKRLSSIDAKLTLAETTSVEFTPVGVTKALGLQKLCDYLGCTLDQCVAVGDAPNDTDALRAAGLAVAMGNATDDIKQLANVIVADNDHDGIREVIERFF